MTKQQLQITLEKAEKMEFLDLIEFLTGEEKTYKKGEFYKKTQIPLLVLFKEYVAYTTTKENVVSKLLKGLSTVEDYENIKEKIGDLLDYLNKSPEIIRSFEGLFSKLIDTDQLKEMTETLEEQIQKIKQ